MSDCLGFSVLGLCAYDPANPPRIYFSIGEVTAALIITLMIPQFLKPIYKFRLANQAIQISHIYLIVFIGAACVLIATVLPNIRIPRGSIFAYPVFWELAGGVLFLGAFGALAFALLWPAQARRGRYPKFARAAADLLAHADRRDQTDFSKDLLRNVEGLIDAAAFAEFRRERSAFFEFQYRRELEDASFAWSLLQLVAEPQFCATLVDRCPWDAAAMLRRISAANLVSRAAADFVREIGRQAIICPSSMMGREIGYTGFHAAPVLSDALFGDWFLNKQYKPLFNILFADFKDADSSTVDRLMHALRSTLKTVIDAGDYWGNYSLSSMESYLGSATREANRRVRAERTDYSMIVSIDSGLHWLIEDITDHLENLAPSYYNRLYVTCDSNRHFDNVLDYIAEAIVTVLNSFAGDFEGHEDAFWSIAIRIVNDTFNKFGEQPDGMDPLQQRVAIRCIEQVKKNMKGYYPALTRILLSVIGPYDEPGNINPKSAFCLFRDAFYLELMHFPTLYKNDPEKAADYLPNDVRYDPENVAFVKTYRLGEERSTALRALSIEPVSLHTVRRSASCARASSLRPEAVP